MSTAWIVPALLLAAALLLFAEAVIKRSLVWAAAGCLVLALFFGFR